MPRQYGIAALAGGRENEMSTELRVAAQMERMQADGEVEFRQAMERLAGTRIECTESFLREFFQLGYVRGIMRMGRLVDELGLVPPPC
jgi:hypothetical protein